MTRRFAALTAAVLIAGCATNPVTGKSQLSLISEDQEIQMGREAAAQVQQSIGFVDNPSLQQYVARVGKEIAAKTERPNLPWEFHVVDDPSVNAFALPGGFIFVTRGLMTHMNNEAELATVLGHEIGHVTARHSVSQMSQQELYGGLLGVGSILSPTIAKYSQLASAGLSLLFLKYSRDDESQADALGFRYALADNYDVRYMDNVFQTLERVSEAAGNQGDLPNWLSTHPDPGNRIQATQARLDSLSRSLSGTKVDRAQYMSEINNLVYGEDPREGFFQGSTFYHPELRFSFSIPNGWQTQNTPQAVAAASPQQDAIFQLTLASGGSPQEAANAFFGQQGIQAGNVSSTSVNGFPAVAGYFDAPTDQGVIRGLVSFLSYGGKTYQLMGYAGSGNFASYDPIFRQIISSFQQMNDPSIINVQPARIDIVTVPQAMSLEEFNQKYPSTVPVQQVALINELEPDSRIAAGQKIKRITGGRAP